LGVLFMGGFFAVKASQNEINLLKLFGNGKYLILLQNNSEMRPTGGFIGSFAVIELSNYKIKNINFNTNIYKLDQAYSVDHLVPPPKPLSQVSNNRWTLRDSNFAVSYPEAAQKIQWFYNQETGENVDGVIAINASVAKDLLAMTGPIKLPNYDTSISSDNFFTELTTQIEKNYYETSVNRDVNEPKSILKDLLPVLVSRLMQKNKIDVAKKLYAEISEKQILFYSNNSNIEQSILSKNWGGEIKNTQSDYLSINNANIGGGKSSLSIKESLDYSVSLKNKDLISELTITRSHFGLNVWPDGVNNNYIRVLVPENSSLVSAELNGKDVLKSTEVGKEAGKTYFAIYTHTAPQISDVISLSYKLPIEAKNYSLLMQKQPGNLGDKLSVKYQNKLLFDGILNKDVNISSS